MTPTSRALADCRKRGWRAAVVERWIPQTRRRLDVFGFIDLVVLDGQPGILGLQVTSSDHISHRIEKIRTECADDARAWLAAGNRVAVWGYAKRGKAGARKLWTLREVAVESVPDDDDNSGTQPQEEA